LLSKVIDTFITPRVDRRKIWDGPASFFK